LHSVRLWHHTCWMLGKTPAAAGVNCFNIRRKTA
jgi:hypothetical protein